MRVLVADDHAIVRRGLRLLLGDAGIHDVTDAANGREAVAAATRVCPDLAILDLRMPELDGIGAARALRALARPPAIAILTMFEDITCLSRSLEAGARAVLAKSTVDEELLPAIQAMRSDRTFITRRLTEEVDHDALRRLRMHGVHDPYELLTTRERLVLAKLAEGLPNRCIARDLSIGVATVETHRAHLMEKLGLHSAADIVLYAFRRQHISKTA